MLRYSPERSLQFYDQALDRVRAIPGVEAAALATRVPFSVNVSRWDDIWIPGRHQPGQPGDTIDVTRVSTDYFKTVGVAIVQGRSFTDADRPNTPRVAMVNETFARRYWPNDSAIGKTFHTRGGAGPAFEIVGVSADHKVATVGEAPTPFIHVARSQQPNAYNARHRADGRRRRRAAARHAPRAARTRAESRLLREPDDGSGDERDAVSRARRSARRRHRRRRRDAAGRHWSLRRDRVLRLAQDARDRHPDGTRRQRVDGAAARHASGADRGSRRAHRRLRCRLHCGARSRGPRSAECCTA